MSERRLLRPRPHIVLARHLIAADWEAAQDIAVWCGGQLIDPSDYETPDERPLIFIPDATGTAGVYANDGDWIVKAPSGAVAVLDAQALDATYQPVVEL